MIGPIKVHVDNKGVIGGLRKGESKCIKPRAGDADLWIQIWEELHSLAERYFGRSKACKGAPHEEKKEKYVAVCEVCHRMQWEG